MENKFLGIMSFSIVIEGMITYLNQFVVDGVFSWKMLSSIILGIVVAISYDLNITSYFNFKSKIPFIGNLITGILISRGANYVYNSLNLIINLK